MKKFFIFTLLIATVLTLTSCGSQTIKIQDYIDVKFEPAYNGYAKPILEIDEDSLNELMNPNKTIRFIEELLKSNEDYEDMSDDIVELLSEEPELIPGFTTFFDIDFDNNYKELKNGDTVVVKITLNRELEDVVDITLKEVAKKLGIKISKTEFEFEVKDLEELSAVEVNLDKLFNVDFGKYDGYASPSVEIDYKYLENLIIDEFVDNLYNQTSNWDVRRLLNDDCEDWIDAKFDQSYNNLKNGDIIKVNIVLDDEFTENGISLADFEAAMGLDFNGGINTYVVEGLAKPQNVVDIFTDIEKCIIFEGANGYGYIGYPNVKIPADYSYQVGDVYLSKGTYANAVKVIYKNTNIGEFTYHIDGTKLSGGDTLKLTADSIYSNVIKTLEDAGYIVPSMSKNITVPDLGEYLTSQDQLTPEVITAIKAQIPSSNINKLYFTTFKPGIECKYNSTAFITAIYYKSGFWDSGYCIDELYNVIIKSDGTVKIESYQEDDTWNAANSIDGAIAKLDKKAYEFVIIE